MKHSRVRNEESVELHHHPPPPNGVKENSTEHCFLTSCSSASQRVSHETYSTLAWGLNPRPPLFQRLYTWLCTPSASCYVGVFTPLMRHDWTTANRERSGSILRDRTANLLSWQHFCTAGIKFYYFTHDRPSVPWSHVYLYFVHLPALHTIILCKL